MLKNLVKYLTMGSSLIATLGTLFVFIYTVLIFEKPFPSDQELINQMIDNGKTENVPQGFKLDRLVVNLKNETTRLRFLDLEIHIVPYRITSRSILEKNKDIIYDSIIDITSAMEPDELNTISGKVILENRIVNTLNRLLKAKLVKDILFTRFVIR